MGRHLYLNGVDRWGDYIGGTLGIDAALSYAIDTATFTIRGAEPEWGQEVFIEDDTQGRLFGGTVVGVKGRSVPEDPTVYVWDVECDDFTGLVAHKRVTGVFQNRNVVELAQSLVGIYTNLDMEAAEDDTDAERLAWDDQPLNEVLNDLAAILGWHWWVDFDRLLHFRPLTIEEDPAPLTLTPGGDFRNLVPSVNVQGMKNKVRVTGGLVPSSYTLEWTFAGDGTTRVFHLPHTKISDVVVTVAGGVRTVGVETLHEEEDFQWFMNYEKGHVRPANQTATPTAGQAIVVIYRRAVPVVAVVEDTDSQAALAALMGTDGIIEDSIRNSSILSYEAAVVAGQEELNLWANPQVALGFDTYTPGWVPGQIVAVELDDRGITNTYLVQKVKVTAPTADHFSTQVQAGSNLKGLADFIANLATRTSYTVDPELTVGRVDGFTEVITVADSLDVDGNAFAGFFISPDTIIGQSEITE